MVVVRERMRFCVRVFVFCGVVWCYVLVVGRCWLLDWWLLAAVAAAWGWGDPARTMPEAPIKVDHKRLPCVRQRT